MTLEFVTRGAGTVTRCSFVLPTVALAVALFAPSVASAHDLRVGVKVDAGAVRIEADYEGEIPAQAATVTLTDSAGTVVASGKTDDRGAWSCPRPSPGTYSLVVEQAGHRAKETVVVPGDGSAMSVSPVRMNKWAGLAIGLGTLLVLTVAFKFARRKPATGGAL